MHETQKKAKQHFTLFNRENTLIKKQQHLFHHLCRSFFFYFVAGSTSNGTLTIGGVDESLSNGPITYVEDVGGGFHSVQVANILVGDATSNTFISSTTTTTTAVIPVDTSTIAAASSSDTVATAAAADATIAVPVNKGAILDTGTNILLLPPALLAQVATAVCSFTGWQVTHGGGSVWVGMGRGGGLEMGYHFKKSWQPNIVVCYRAFASHTCLIM